MKNHFETLLLHYDANDDEIKQSYKELIKKYHPDLNGSFDAIEKSKEINGAYKILSNKEKRNSHLMELWFDEEIKFSKKILINFSKKELLKIVDVANIDHYIDDSKDRLIKIIIDCEKEIEEEENYITVAKLKEDFTKEDIMNLCEEHNISFNRSLSKKELINLIRPKIKIINDENLKKIKEETNYKSNNQNNNSDLINYLEKRKKEQNKGAIIGVVIGIVIGILPIIIPLIITSSVG